MVYRISHLSRSCIVFVFFFVFSVFVFFALVWESKTRKYQENQRKKYFKNLKYHFFVSSKHFLHLILGMFHYLANLSKTQLAKNLKIFQVRSTKQWTETTSICDSEVSEVHRILVVLFWMRASRPLSAHFPYPSAELRSPHRWIREPSPVS